MSNKEIYLNDCLRFCWLIEGKKHPEIYGWVENEDGQIVKQSAGWYRTTDPTKAAEIARGGL